MAPLYTVVTATEQQGDGISIITLLSVNTESKQRAMASEETEKEGYEAILQELVSSLT